MKKILAMLLALLLVCSLAACAQDDEGSEDPVDLTVTSNEQYHSVGGDYNDHFEYEIINGDEVAIVGFDSDHTPHDIVIPDTIEKRPVVEISDTAFYQCSQLKTVTVPAGVVKIGDMAFAGCVQLTEVKFAEGAAPKQIGDYAFANCDQLETVTLPQSLTTLGEGAFFRCKALTAINIPNVVKDEGGNVVSGITAIQDMTFMGCEGLATVTGGNDLVSIGAYAFSGCMALTAYTVPAGVTSLGAYAFSLCDTLATVTFADVSNWGYLADGAEVPAIVSLADAAANALLLKGELATYTLSKYTVA